MASIVLDAKPAAVDGKPLEGDVSDASGAVLGSQLFSGLRVDKP